MAIECAGIFSVDTDSGQIKDVHHRNWKIWFPHLESSITVTYGSLNYEYLHYNSAIETLSASLNSKSFKINQHGENRIQTFCFSSVLNT